MQAKVESVQYFGIIFLASLMLFTAEGRADTSTTGDTGTASATATNTAANKSKRKARHTFYLGVCVGQTLAKQGTYFSDVLANVTDANREDLKIAIRNALTSCKEAMKPQAKPAPSAAPTPTATPVSTDSTATTTTASES